MDGYEQFKQGILEIAEEKPKKRKKKKPEATFQGKFTSDIHWCQKKYLPNEGYVYQKMSDQSQDVKPSDCFLMNSVGTYLIELKVTDNQDRFTINSLLQGIQEVSLRNAHNPSINRYGYVCIKIRSRKLKKGLKPIVMIPYDEELYSKQVKIDDMIYKYSIPYIYDEFTRTNRLNILNKL